MHTSDLSYTSNIGAPGDGSLHMLATVTHANHRVLVASLGLPVPYPAHIPLPPLHVHATPEITYRHVLPTQPPLSCVAQTPIPCSARAAQDTHSYFSCLRILEGMTGVSFVSLTGRQRLLLLCMGGRVAYFLNTMFACNETWQRQQRLMYAICSFKAHRARACPVLFKTRNPQPATLTPPPPPLHVLGRRCRRVQQRKRHRPF